MSNNIFKSHKNLTANEALKAFLIKNSIYWVLGRNRDGRLILYSILSRLVLLFARPIAVIIHEGDIGKPNFKSLDNIDTCFGDEELAREFNDRLYNKGMILDDCEFSFFNTKYKILFFIIKYSDTGLLKDVMFKPVRNREPSEEIDKELYERFDWGFFAQLGIILEDRMPSSGDFSQADLIKINHIVPDLERVLSEEFKNFPWSQGFEAEKSSSYNYDLIKNFSDNNSQHREEINKLLGIIREKLVRKVYGSVNKAPLVSGVDDSFDNIFLFIKTVTNERSEYEGGGKKLYRFPYTLRLVLEESGGQKERIREYYERIASGSKKCGWYDADRNECRIKNGKDNIGLCLFNQSSPMSIDTFMENLENPFVERSFLDTPLASGILGVADVYPDFSRSRLQHNDRVNVFKLWSKKVPITARHACTLCLTHQVVPYSERISPIAIATPILIGGASSMVILTMSARFNDPSALNDNKRTPEDKRNQQEWMRAYSAYLAINSRLSTYRIRAVMKSLFLEELKNAIRDSYSSAFDDDDLKNKGKLFFSRKYFNDLLIEKSKKLSHIYPLEMVSFPEKGSEDYRVKIFPGAPDSSDNDFIYFSVGENLLFSRLFKHRYLKEEDVRRCLEDGIREAGVLVLARMGRGRVQ